MANFQIRGANSALKRPRSVKSPKIALAPRSVGGLARAANTPEPVHVLRASSVASSNFCSETSDDTVLSAGLKRPAALIDSVSQLPVKRARTEELEYLPPPTSTYSHLPPHSEDAFSSSSRSTKTNTPVPTLCHPNGKHVLTAISLNFSPKTIEKALEECPEGFEFESGLDCALDEERNRVQHAAAFYGQSDILAHFASRVNMLLRNDKGQTVLMNAVIGEGCYHHKTLLQVWHICGNEQWDLCDHERNNTLHHAILAFWAHPENPAASLYYVRTVLDCLRPPHLQRLSAMRNMYDRTPMDLAYLTQCIPLIALMLKHLNHNV